MAQSVIIYYPQDSQGFPLRPFGPQHGARPCSPSAQKGLLSLRAGGLSGFPLHKSQVSDPGFAVSLFRQVRSVGWAVKYRPTRRPNLLRKRAHLQVARLSVSTRPLHYWPRQRPYRKETAVVWFWGSDGPAVGRANHVPPKPLPQNKQPRSMIAVWVGRCGWPKAGQQGHTNPIESSQKKGPEPQGR